MILRMNPSLLYGLLTVVANDDDLAILGLLERLRRTGWLVPVTHR